MNIENPGRLHGLWVAGVCAVAAVSLFGAGRLYAAEYYVDNNHPSAADSNPGTEDLPWLTIQHAADVVVAGDTVYVKTGLYEERVRPANTGEAGARISFVAQPRRSVDMYGFNTTDCDYLTIRGFNITNSDLFTGWDETQGVFIRSNHVEVIDNYFHHMHSTAIVGYWHEPYPEYATVADNTVYHIQMGITISGTGWVVERNEVNRLIMHAGGGDCDYSRFFGDDHVIRHNFFHGTSFDEIGSAHVDCFQTFTNNGEHAYNILFEGNVCYDFHQGLMASNVENTATSHFTFRNNIFAHGGAWGICVHDISNIVLENNTFAFIQYHGAGFRGNSTGNVAVNNIFYEISTSYWGDEGGEVTGDYNIIYNSRAPDAPGANDLVDVDPLFVDPQGDGFYLQPGSPAIDAGDALAQVTADLNGTPRPQGGGWDIGAYEYIQDPPLMITTVSLPNGQFRQEYLAELRCTGGTEPHTWSIPSGSLPTGVSLDPATGRIAGVPTEWGMFEFTAEVTDSATGVDSRLFSITIIGNEDRARSGGGCGCWTGGERSVSWFFVLLALLVVVGVGRRRVIRKPGGNSPDRPRRRP